MIVQKYGGTSVGSAARIRRVSRRIADTVKKGHQVVAVVSAMGRTTDRLIALAQSVNPEPPARELDMLVANGETITAPLVAMCLQGMGVPAVSLSGAQAGVRTSEQHSRARIRDIKPDRILEALGKHQVPVVAGFQGVTEELEITTLGRGGSDTTAVALAAALRADACEIYTDVDGIFTADPRIVPAARRIPAIKYEEMLEMAASGAKVLQLRCVEYARRYGVPIHVRSSFSNRPGTWVSDEPREAEGPGMEQAIISGVAHDRSEAKVTVLGVPDVVGQAAKIFRAIATAGINIDMIVQNISAATTGLTDISFTLPRADGEAALAALRSVQEEIKYEDLLYDDRIGKVSLVGAGMRSHPGVTATFFGALAEAGVNIEMISTSEIRISVVVDENEVDAAVTATHRAFKLDTSEVEAVVYGGTGR